MQIRPSRLSATLASGRCRQTWRTVSRNPEDSNLRPSNPLSWDVAIITDVADVNPTVTGTEMKSISTPVQENQTFLEF